MSGASTRGNKKVATTPAGGTTVAAAASSSSSSSSLVGADTGGEDDNAQGEGSDSEEAQRQQLSSLQQQHRQQDEQQAEGPTDAETAQLTAELLQLQREVATAQQVRAQQQVVTAAAAATIAAAVQQQAIRAQIKAQKETLAQMQAQIATGTAGRTTASVAAVPSSSSSSRAHPTAAPQTVKYKGLDPTELRAADASKGTTLEDWIYSVERLMDQSETTDFDRQMRMAGGFWDRQVNIWWKGHEEMRRQKGEPINDWAGWVAALRANYTPTSDVDAACGQLFQLTMRAGESMDRYVARAHELYSRIPRRRVTAEAAAEHMQRGVDARRYPLTLVSIGTEQQRERTRNGGKGLSFEATRGLLVEAAVREPSHLIAGAAAAAAASASNRGQQRVNTLGQHQSRYPPPDDEGEEGYGEDEEQSVNAIAAASVTCYRCKQQGHFASACPNADARQCNKCKGYGHIARDCSKQQRGGGGRAKQGVPLTTKVPKNE